MTVPSPSTWMPPPSLTIDELKGTAPATSAANAPTCCSSSHTQNSCSPQPLKRHNTAPRRPSGSVTKVGPLSRNQLSSIGVSAMLTAGSTRARATSPSPTSQISVTGSKRAMALVTAAHTRRNSPRSPSGSFPNVMLAGGNSIHVRSWRTHSGGMANCEAALLVILHPYHTSYQSEQDRDHGSEEVEAAEGNGV